MNPHKSAMSRSQAFEESENVGRNASANPTMGDIIAARYNRRDLLKSSLAVAAITATVSPLALAAGRRAEAAAPEASFGFTEIEAGVDETHHVAPGYRADILIRWGDPVLPGAPAFDPSAQTAAAQKQQFGYNNDFVGYFPIEGSSEHGLLVVNHEYTNEELMFPGLLGPQDTKEASFGQMTQELADIEMAAHGGSVLEIRKVDGRWQVVPDSKYNRRITTADTEMELTGPAAGHALLQTKADPTGTKVVGMVNNCAGGVTPWGTWLSAEENFHGYFWGKVAEDSPLAASLKRYGVPGNWYNWGAYYDRFDVTKEPNEAQPLRLDGRDRPDRPRPRRPRSAPPWAASSTRVRGVIVNKDGKVVAYMGDDERFDYVYRFVTAGTVRPEQPRRQHAICSTRARSRSPGSTTTARSTWLPLVHGQGPLTGRERLQGPGRRADLGAAAPAICWVPPRWTGPRTSRSTRRPTRSIVMLTNNNKRKAEQVDAANPRPENLFGHIVEMTPPDGDHAADQVRLGHPGQVRRSQRSPRSAPRSARHHGQRLVRHARQLRRRRGRAACGSPPTATTLRRTGRTDGVWAMETEGELRGTSQLFFRVPIGAEMCGPKFTPDDKTLFVAVQHPGEEDREGKPAHLRARPRPAGRTSRPACRRGRRSSSSPRRTAA